MQNRLVVIGASAGGIETVRDLVRALPADFPAPIAIVIHTSPQSPGIIHEILSRSTALTVVNPRGTERLRAGWIYVAPPDWHLVVEPGRIRTTRGPRENRFRPAIDPLFRSAAQVFGPAAIGVVLTGNLDDGTAGLWAIKQLGGIAIVQDPEDALYPSMPASARQHVAVDHVVPLRDLPPLLLRLTATAPAAEPIPVPPDFEPEVRIAKEENPMQSGVERLGTPSKLTCPECHGVLMQMKEGQRTRFRCHTGHAYSGESLLADVNEGIEAALWNAMRAVQEGRMLMQEMATHAQASHPGTDNSKLVERVAQLEQHVEQLRGMMTGAEQLTRDSA